MVRQLAHEIKNPLGGLRGAAQLLERELKDRSLHEYTSVIISEADRLAALVDALLGPGQPPRKEPVNIHEIVQHVGHLLAGEAPAGVRDRARLRSEPAAAAPRSQSAHPGAAEPWPQRRAVGRTSTAASCSHARADEREHRQPPAPCRRQHPGRGRRARRAGRAQGHDFLSAGHRATRAARVSGSRSRRTSSAVTRA